MTEMAGEPAGGTVLDALLAGGKLPPRPGRPGQVDWAWSSRAACRMTSDDEAARMVEATQLDDARDLIGRWCATCPVALACLTAGRATRASGVWGGTVMVDGTVAGKGRAGASVDAPPTTGAVRDPLELLVLGLTDLLAEQLGVDWTGTPRQLAEALSELSGRTLTVAGAPGSLSRALTSAAERLRAAGIEVERRRGKARLWTVRRVPASESAAQAS